MKEKPNNGIPDVLCVCVMGDGRGIAKSPFPHSVLLCANNLANAAPHAILKEDPLRATHTWLRIVIDFQCHMPFRKCLYCYNGPHTKLHLLLEI